MAKSTGQQFSESLARDGSHAPIQIGGSFQTADATATPQTSPLAYSSSVITIVVPDRATEFIVNPSTALRISEVVGMGTYDVVALGSKEVIDCSKMQNIYIKRDSVDGTANFRFTIV